MERPDQTDLAFLCRCYDAYAADVLRGMLETNGIECFLLDYHHAQNAPHMQMMVNIRVMVRSVDLETAKDLIKDTESYALSLPAGETRPQSYAESATWWNKTLSILVFMLTMIPFPLQRKSRLKK